MKMIEKVNIIGLGALGMLYGKCMTETLGYENVCYIMSRDRYERNKDQKYICNGEECRFHMVPIDEAPEADLVVVAVKYPGLESAIEDMAGSIGRDTVIMSVMLKSETLAPFSSSISPWAAGHWWSSPR